MTTGQSKNRILQLIPANEGWRAAFWCEDGSVIDTPVACWALVEIWKGNIRDQSSWGKERPPWDRHIESMIEGDYGLHEASDATNFLGLIAPGSAVPQQYLDEAKHFSEAQAVRSSSNDETK